MIPLQYMEGQNAASLGLTGKESFSISLPEKLVPGQVVDVKVCVCVLCVWCVHVCMCVPLYMHVQWNLSKMVTVLSL